MLCNSCRRPYDTTDNFCRRCGAGLVVEVPVLRRSEPLPVPWEQVKPAVARGVVALAAGMALELALRSLGRFLGGEARALVRRPASAKPVSRPMVVEITEAVFIRQVRRVS